MSLELMEGSNAAKVATYLNDFKGSLPPNRIIGEALNLSRMQAASAIGYLRREKGLFLSTDSDSLKRLREAQIIARGGKWYKIKSYAYMRMVQSEICLAHSLDRGEEVDLLSVSRQLRNARSSREITGLTADERLDLSMSVYRASEDQRRDSVALWLKVRDVLRERGIVPNLSSRIEWRFLIRELAMVREETYEKEVIGSERLLSRLSEEQQDKLRPFVEVIRGVTLMGHIRANFVDGNNGKKTNKVFKDSANTIKRIDSLSLVVADKERLFRCLFWEEKGASAYARFFNVPKEKLWQNLKDLIDDDMDELHARYDSLVLAETR